MSNRRPLKLSRRPWRLLGYLRYICIHVNAQHEIHLVVTINVGPETIITEFLLSFYATKNSFYTICINLNFYTLFLPKWQPFWRHQIHHHVFFFFKTLFIQFSIHFSLAALPSSQQLSWSAIDFPVRSGENKKKIKCKGLYNDTSRV